jgi:hypothetical protein
VEAFGAVDFLTLAGITYSRPASRPGEEIRRDSPYPPNEYVGLICVLVCVLAPLLIERPLTAQAALTVPAGLPDWAFNIPDKVQPTAVRPEGIVRAPGSAKEYDAAAIAGNANPPDWFPDEHPPRRDR